MKHARLVTIVSSQRFSLLRCLLRSSVAAKKQPNASSDGKNAGLDPAEFEQLSFEQAVERLEEIVRQVEQGEIGLEQSIQEYERGMLLIKRCKDVLAHAEQRVEELSREAMKKRE